MSGDKAAPLGKDEIVEILKLLEESRFDELRLEMDGFKLVLSKNTAGIATAASETPPAAPPAPEPQAAAPQAEEPGLVAVRSPILGIFYRAPKPGAPPFVEQGSRVGPEDTVCLIEVMKLFNTVKAGVAGRIARVCAENGKMVEYDQLLFLVEPE
jgi:acetyl-CoA carboxylase biotin carboxyl carrier protein